jgi:hypothetical protein
MSLSSASLLIRRTTSLLGTISTLLVAACTADPTAPAAAVKAPCPTAEVSGRRRPRLDPADLEVVAFNKTAATPTSGLCELRANIRLTAGGQTGARK